MATTPDLAPTYPNMVKNVALRLQGVAPTERGIQGKAKHTAPPRYTWIWVGCDPAPSKSGRASSTKTLGDEVHRVLVEIWAKTEDDMLAMRRALITAVRAEIGNQRLEVGPGDLNEPATDANGIKVDVSLQCRLPALDTFLPPQTPAAAAGSSPANVVRDATYPLAAITNANDQVPATSTPGDGVLEFTES